jgi:rubrerythrin
MRRSLFAADANKATLENLNKAFNGESNAHARYLAFAKKADEEGYGQVACLFRAAASAEKIHFTAEGKIIQRLGGVPKADVKAPEVKSTKENLEAAIKGETYESQTMYPEFIKTAEAEGVKDAVEKFTEALGYPLTSYGAQGYSAIYTIYDVLQRAQSLDKEKIRDAFAATNITSGPALIMGWQKIAFDKDGQNVDAHGVISQNLNGKRTTIWPVANRPKGLKPVWPIPSWKDRK